MIKKYFQKRINLGLDPEVIFRPKKDCINCVKWDLYCTLGKDVYYQCRAYNFCFFKGVGD